MSWDVQGFTKRLVATVRAFDKNGTTALCDELITYLRRTDDLYPVTEAKRVLQHLRNKRYFELMQQVADALIQSGQKDAQIRRQYAQSLLDQGNLTAALNVLQALVADTANDPSENAEVRGLIGRAYKQLYVDAQDSISQRNRQNLACAIRSYHQVYSSDPENHLWPGINTVALLCRAERERVPLSGFPNASTLASEILQKVEAKDLDGHEPVPAWDLATAVEACVALGKSEEALSWARRYVDQSSADAFELASTLRQLTQVWQLQTQSEPGARLLPLLNAALLKREGGNLTVDSQDFRPGPLDQLAQGGQLEKVLGKDGFATYKWYKTGLERCRAVARIEREDEQGFGTGFLIKGADLHSSLGEELLLLTNAHVVSNDPSVKGVLRPHEAVITFQGLNAESGERKAFQVAQVLWTSPPHQLDASLLRLNQSVSGVEPYPLTLELPVIDENDPQRIYIIGHPEGGTLSFSIHDNLLLDYENPVLHYRTPTEGGSSGSPVFNQQWRLIALHHKGGKQMRRLNGKPGTYESNEGIWIQTISKAVATQLSH